MNTSSVALYTQAQLAIQSGKASEQDRLIVAMWELNHGSVQEIMNLRLQNNQLALELAEANRKIAESHFTLAMAGAMAKGVPTPPAMEEHPAH